MGLGAGHSSAYIVGGNMGVRKKKIENQLSLPVAPETLIPTNLETWEEPTTSSLAELSSDAVEVLTEEDEAKLLERLSSTDMARLYLSNESEGKRNYQQSLDLFREGIPVTRVKEELLLKKVSQRVRFVNPLKLLQSKLHNALIFVARPTMSTQQIFSVSLDYLSWLVDHNVNDYAYLKASLSEMQQALMQIPDGNRWFSTQMIQDVLIEGTTLHYKIPAFLCRLYAAPDRYHHVSMRMNARFKSKYTLNLYELLRENLWRGETGYMALDEFRERMGVGPDEYTEFKRLSMRVIQPALVELESLGDIFASVRYGREKRFVTSLNFIIVQNPNSKLAFEGAYLDPGRYKELREEFGLNQKQVKEIAEGFQIERIEAIADVLLYRYVFNKQKNPVKNWFSLFKSALRDEEDRYLLTNSEKAELSLFREKRQQAALLEDSQRRERELERRRTTARKDQGNRMDEYWSQLGEGSRQELWDEFLGSPEGKHFRQARKLSPGSRPDVTHPLARASFADFLKRLAVI
ncbi:RepB family plasmid replication initiator protein [Caballeronia sp. GAWG2-1]|uniref:replication initiation protein n=1 Tax=Caballeronia sp. GAWG2-1 TaxID=2921744 RepID=UPI0020281976|nr:RepB family plasmid replication initiator protein [Caballeronia sp. GAWG2-1]